MINPPKTVPLIMAMIVLAAAAHTAQAQTGSGMMGRCPMCGGPMMGGISTTSIPNTLPTPKNRQWISRLQAILTLERLSRAQYTADEDKYQVRMPYMMIIPQEDSHIELISKLFEAYGIHPERETPAIKRTTSVTQAYRVGQNIESGQIPKYVWLVRHSEDNTSKQVLEGILVQTRMHYMMFTHALEMGGRGMMH